MEISTDSTMADNSNDNKYNDASDTYQAARAKSTAKSTATSSKTTETSTPRNTSTPSKISLREITESNWRAVANLRLPPSQAGNLAPNPMSMCEGHYSEDAWMRAIYANDTTDTIEIAGSNNTSNTANTATTTTTSSSSPIGFLMLALWPPTSGYYIWRLMIAAPYQRRGYGRDVVRAAIEHVKTTYPAAERLGVMSTPKEGCARKRVRAEDSPFGFYEALGFRQTEEPDEDGEIMMEIEL